MERESTITVTLPDDQAVALAQLCKRIGWNDCRSLAVDDAEARLMIAATDMLAGALREAGFAVR